METTGYPDDVIFPNRRQRSAQLQFIPGLREPQGHGALTDDNTNTYKVIVVASDDALGADGTDGAVSGEMAEKKVELTVTEVEEPGQVTLSALYAQVGVPITATLTDDDLIPNANRRMPVGNGTKADPEQPKPRAVAMLLPLSPRMLTTTGP